MIFSENIDPESFVLSRRFYNDAYPVDVPADSVADPAHGLVGKDPIIVYIPSAEVARLLIRVPRERLALLSRARVLVGILAETAVVAVVVP